MIYFTSEKKIGKCRLQQFFDEISEKERNLIIRELTNIILTRSTKLSNFLEYKGSKIVYKKYGSLWFIFCIDSTDNEFIILELIRQYVEILDMYYNGICELDLVFTFNKAYYCLQELIMAGETYESSKKVILQALRTQDLNEEIDASLLPEI